MLNSSNTAWLQKIVAPFYIEKSINSSQVNSNSYFLNPAKFSIHFLLLAQYKIYKGNLLK